MAEFFDLARPARYRVDPAPASANLPSHRQVPESQPLATQYVSIPVLA